MNNAKTFQDWCKEILPIVQAAANGAVIEFKQGDAWFEKSHNDLCYDYEYRIKPKTVRIGEYDVPEPLRKMPTLDAICYIADPASSSLHSAFTWTCSVDHINWCNRGIVHSTKDSAVLHAEALLSLTEVRL